MKERWIYDGMVSRAPDGAALSVSGYVLKRADRLDALEEVAKLAAWAMAYAESRRVLGKMAGIDCVQQSVMELRLEAALKKLAEIGSGPEPACSWCGEVHESGPENCRRVDR